MRIKQCCGTCVHCGEDGWCSVFHEGMISNTTPYGLGCGQCWNPKLELSNKLKEYDNFVKNFEDSPDFTNEVYDWS